jgi:Flp pilus assembly protein TadD
LRSGALCELAFFLNLIFNHTAMATQQTFASAAIPLSASDQKATASTSRPKSPWILDRWRDLLFFVGTPVLLIPLFAIIQKRWNAQDIYLFVAAFGAMGHHLPGMIRAYGDRALFARFRTRFIVAPIVLVAVSVWASLYNIQAIQLLALVWGIWHGMMQTYGFGRIYDAKASARAPARARADLALCFAWFLGAVLLSPMRMRTLLDVYYESGGLVIPAAAIGALRAAVVLGLGFVTIVFLWRQWADWQGGRGASPVKIALLTTSIAFWWYCNNGVQNILVGVALFEVFHDVQYLSIVWIYNRTRVERDESIRGFMRFVFRRSGSLIGVYVGLVLAYGSIAFLQSSAAVEWIKHGLIGVVTASALLHFYYDGFIWKVRETQTRSMLGIDGAGVSAPTRRGLPGWAGHSLRWAALAIPFGLLCAAQLVGRAVPPLERFAKVAEVVPQDAQAQLNYGKALHEAGRVEEAIPRYESAIKLKPSLAEAEFFHGLAESDLEEWDRSVAHYERAISLDPKNAKAECNLASVLVREHKYDEARRRYEHSLQVDPTLFLAHKQLADLLCQAGEYDAAIGHYNEALRLRPNFPEAKDNLAFARSLAGR